MTERCDGCARFAVASFTPCGSAMSGERRGLCGYWLDTVALTARHSGCPGYEPVAGAVTARCADCGAPVFPARRYGRPPERCAECRAARERQKRREYNRRRYEARLAARVAGGKEGAA